MTKRQLKRRARKLQRRMKKQWKHFDTRQRTMMVAGATIQVTLFTLAQIDITKRDPDEIRGSKLFWRLVCFINLGGPILYFAFGRKPPLPEIAPVETASVVA